MNGTAEQPASASNLDETIDYDPNRIADQFGSDGANAMAKNSPQGQARYTFTSGSRPLDGYTIKRAIGRGGFGEVYYATSDSGKEVALKFITRNVEVERRGVAQCMNLKCPNLLAIYDIKANEAGETFVIMEYVAGPSLASVLAANPKGLPPQEVRAWLQGLVDGVDYLHDHGIVHRDLKPANMFLEEGVVKIGDYGLSKLISAERGSAHSESIGTCHYMAPEISTGKYHKPIDIYAIGVILYEMLTGRVPFEGETVGEVLMKHLTARPDLSALPEPYRSIIGRALAKDPAQRPARATELLPSTDARPARDVRFIGEGKAAPLVDLLRGGVKPEPQAQAQAHPKLPPGEEDVLRITDEEPVFYIGPDTRPPQQPRRGGSWFWLPVGGRRPAPGTTPNGQGRIRRAWAPAAGRGSTPPPPPRPAPAPVPPPAPVYKAKAPVPPPGPPAPPPPLPQGRIRVAQTTSAMLSAAPITAILSTLLAAGLGMDPSHRPQELAFLFGISLLGTWSVLANNAWTEGRSLDRFSRRFSYMVWGLGVGLVAQLLASWTLVPLHPLTHVSPVQIHLFGQRFNFMIPELLGLTSYFGLTYFCNNWWKVTQRDRPSRFRIRSVLGAGLIAGLLSLVWEGLSPAVFLSVPLTAMVAQIVSPWNESAARYAKYYRGAPPVIA